MRTFIEQILGMCKVAIEQYALLSFYIFWHFSHFIYDCSITLFMFNYVHFQDPFYPFQLFLCMSVVATHVHMYIHMYICTVDVMQV